jgi:hypothetical protein
MLRTTHLLGLVLFAATASAQDSELRFGSGVPTSVRVFNKKALTYLAATQRSNGTWEGVQGDGAGVVGICIMAFLASGEDADYGPYAENVRRSVRYLIAQQDAITGYISGTGHGPMYHHGFATLALSEVYGSVNERILWQDSGVPKEQRHSIGQALELAVRCIITSQDNNPWKAWRYSPESSDADTTVSGTVLMGLLGARNAGVKIPNRAIDNAIRFFDSNALKSGMVTYKPAESHGNGLCRAAIATLVYAIAKRQDSPNYAATSTFIKRSLDEDITSYPFYTRYYVAQALFQSNFDAWRVWNARTLELLTEMQQPDGKVESDHGYAYGTGMSVLALALNYRLLPVYER